MAVTATWTDPTTLDRTVGENLPAAKWEGALGDLLYLYDVLTDAVSLAVHLTSDLTVDGAVSVGSLTVGGATPRRTTYGVDTSANRNIPGGGGAVDVYVALVDSVTPLAASATLDTGGNAANLQVYFQSFSAGQVQLNVVNWGASNYTAQCNIHVIADY